MSTQTRAADAGKYEEGFLEQNTWIRPLSLFVVVCLAILALIIGANASMGWLGGRFGQVLFGMVASLVFMSVVVSVVLLAVNGARYLIEHY